MAEPSNSMPRSKASSSSAGVIANDLRNPSTSVNHRRMKRTSRSSTVRSTYSCCLSMAWPMLAGRGPRGGDPGAGSRSAPPGPWTAGRLAGRRCYPDPMERLRLAGAQINPVVGDLDGNVERVLAAYSEAEGRGAHLVVFPELALTGYPPEDLVFKPSFLAASRAAAERVAAQVGETAAVVGFVEPTHAGP